MSFGRPAHAAIAAVNGVDYLVTWNMMWDAGHEPPVICTPSQLMEMEHE